MWNFFKSLLDTNEREISQARKTLAKVNALEPEMQQKSYEQMQARIAEIKAEFKPLVDKIPHQQRISVTKVDRQKIDPAEIAIQKKLLEFLPEVYAMVREIFRREYGKRHYDVQILAAIILAQGQRLTELKTGEGKTQVFQLPVILYSLVGRGAHLVTVNEYLARRDGEYAGHTAEKLGLTVGVIAPGQTAYKFKRSEENVDDPEKVLGLADMQGLNLQQVSKQEAYGCDLTYGVNNEFGFDYLRDNLVAGTDQMVQRELYFCIVDEADSILIDEARTPLIMSDVPGDSDIDKYELFAKLARQLEEKVDFEVDHKTRSVVLTEAGLEKAEKFLKIDNLWSDFSMAYHLENAVKAKALFQLDDHYIVKNGEVLIVDSFTGRVLPGRRYSEGLHQAIEAKEGVAIQQESKTFATITFQNFFRLYKLLCGGSGTVMTEAEEFYKIYELESVEIPTHHTIARIDNPDLIYRNQEVKFRALADEVAKRHQAGQPVLVGTTSVEKSELVSRLLDERNIPHEVLNAKYHEQEAQIVAKAGELGAVTVATNMAGRGTDIPLGKGVKEVGGLAVLGTERHESRRIDNQLRGRAGRQGDPGFTRFYVGLDDQIMRVLGGDLMDRMVGRFMQDDMPIELAMVTRQIESAQKRIEGMNFDIRKELVDYDDVMNKHREIYYQKRRNLIEASERLVNSQLAGNGEAALQAIKSNLEGMYRSEVEYIVDAQLQGDNKLQDEKKVEAIVAHVVDLAPDNIVANAFDFPLNELNSKLAELVRGKNRSDIVNSVWSGVDRMLEVKIAEVGDNLADLVKLATLEIMNRMWMEHLETMHDIRSGIKLQSLAQKDPLVEYKNVAFRRFEEFMHQIDSTFVRRFLKIAPQQIQTVVMPQNIATNEADIEDVLTGDREFLPRLDDAIGDAISSSSKRLEDSRRRLLANSSGGKGVTVQREEEKVGRNDACPCGSGKKYKQCGLINSAEHQANMAKK